MVEVEELEGTIKKIIFNKENFYILQLEASNNSFTVLGDLYDINIDEEIVVWGNWTQHHIYGKQLKVEGFRKKTPDSLEAIKEYLASDIVKGVGEKTAKKIVELYGMDSLKIAQNEPEKLTEIKGITLEKSKQISESLLKAREFENVMLELLPLGLTVKTIIKIYQQFAGNTLTKINENPYILTTVPQIGFIKADSIAEKLNIPFDSIHRIKAGIEFVLMEEANQNGHLYLEKEYLTIQTKKLLAKRKHEIDEEQIGAALSLLEIEGKVVIENEKNIYWGMFNYWEREAALLVREKIYGKPEKFDLPKLEDAIIEYQDKYGLILAEKQKQAIYLACTNKISIITGGPGTGKTQTIKAIIDIWHDMRKKKKIVLAAPTGRAARRMKEITGEEAVTIHRLLKLGKSDILTQLEEGDNVEADLLIVDEFSMVDMHLFYQLMMGVGDQTTVVFIGDTDQLPSVGPGNVLNELIEGKISSIVLTEIFRQANESQIVVNAHRCNKGEKIITNEDQEDFCFIEESNDELVPSLIVKTIEGFIKEGNSIEDIQVLSPMKKTKTGVENLNNIIQEYLNPFHPLKNQLEFKNNIYRVGDKVMQTVNNYEKEVFNGDVGIVYEIDQTEKENQWLKVIYEDKKVKYTKDQLDELVLAYAVTVHKSQGSEYPIVIMPVSTQHYIMLARNLIYTGITRAREKVVMIGTKKALNIAIKNDKVISRNTKLASRIG